jgi:nucleoside-diphosphate-sugar epimerase
MKIAITGGTGFIGRHLARALVKGEHQVVVIARGVDARDTEIRDLDNVTFAPVGTSSAKKLAEAFAGCDAVAHCAGINRALGEQTYERVHIQGTQNVVDAARKAGVKKVLLLSFLRARPHCNSPYHESKWAAEEIVRGCGLDYTIIKAGMIYGKGDHMLDHLSHTLHSLPLFATVGIKEKPIQPVAVEDVVRILQAALLDNRLSRQTVAAIGPQQMLLSDAVRQMARIIGKPVLTFPFPIFAHRILAWFFERTMAVPLISSAQVFMLSEGITEAVPECASLPDDLAPQTLFEDQRIRERLPEPKSFGLKDFRCRACLARK